MPSPVAVAEEAAAAADPAAAESEEDAVEQVMQVLRPRFAAMAALLARVQDAESAAAWREEVRRDFEQTFLPDAGLPSAVAGDEERLAAELEDAFAPVDAELARLEEADFYGDAALRAVFSAAAEENETPEEGVVYPVGLFDFLRGDKTEERRVCPREDNGLEFFDWKTGE